MSFCSSEGYVDIIHVAIVKGLKRSLILQNSHSP